MEASYFVGFVFAVVSLTEEWETRSFIVSVKPFMSGQKASEY